MMGFNQSLVFLVVEKMDVQLMVAGNGIAAM